MARKYWRQPLYQTDRPRSSYDAAHVRPNVSVGEYDEAKERALRTVLKDGLLASQYRAKHAKPDAISNDRLALRSLAHKYGGKPL